MVFDGVTHSCTLRALLDSRGGVEEVWQANPSNTTPRRFRNFPLAGENVGEQSAGKSF